jgi:hypothetical protein
MMSAFHCQELRFSIKSTEDQLKLVNSCHAEKMYADEEAANTK